MTNEELVKTLQYCRIHLFSPCAGCCLFDTPDCIDTLHSNAAAAIEELQAEVKRLEPKRGERTINPYESTWAIENGYI